MSTLIKVCFILFITTIVTACGGGGSSTATGNSSPSSSSSNSDNSQASSQASTSVGSSNTRALTGSVSKGPVMNATVDIYTFNTNGTQGTFVIGGITTDTYGAWSANIPSTATGPFIIVATGGSYIDEYTGVTVSLGSVPLRGILPVGATSAAVTPITDAAVLTIQQMVIDGYASSPTTALSTVKTNYINSFGFDPISTIPPAPSQISGTTSADALKYMALLGGISTLSNDAYTQLSAGGNAPDRMAIVAQIAADFAADGSIDGYGNAAAPLSVNVGGFPQVLNGAFTGGTNLSTAVGTYQALPSAPASVAGATVTITPVDFKKTVFVKTPEILIASPTSGSSYTKDTAGFVAIPITVTISNYTLSSGAWNIILDGVSQGSYNFTTSTTLSQNLTVGSHTIKVQLTGPGKTYTPLASQNTDTITVNVQAALADTTPPAVTAPANLSVAANNAAAISSFLSGARALDTVDGSVSVSHNATLPLLTGPNLITFSATDAAGNTGSATATITVTALPISTTPFSISYPGFVQGATCDASKLNDPLFSGYWYSPWQWTQFTTDPGAVIEVFFDNPSIGLNKVRIRCANLNHSWNAVIPSDAINKTSSAVSITFNNFSMPFSSTSALAPGFVVVPGSTLGITLNGTLNPVIQEDLTATIPTNGKAWSLATTNLTTADKLNGSITFDGTTYRIFQPNHSGYFRPANPDPTSTFYSSTDGLNWVKSTYNMTFEMHSLVWLNGQYTAFVYDWTARKQKLVTSTDGITWTTQTFVPSGFGINAMATDGTTIVAVGAQGYIISSTNGINWTQRSRVKFGITKNHLDYTVWNGTQYVAVGTSGTIVTSLDGISWTVQQSGTNYRITSLATLNGKFFASAATDVNAPVKLIITSSDGITWTRLFKNPVGSLGKINILGSIVTIPYKDATGNKVLTSMDGITWSQETGVANITLGSGISTLSGVFAGGYNSSKVFTDLYQRN